MLLVLFVVVATVTSTASASPSSSSLRNSNAYNITAESSPSRNNTPQIPRSRPTFKGLILKRFSSVPFGYLADPNALVVNGTIYVFCSTDPPTANLLTRYTTMREYSLLTTTSMATDTVWVNHGVILNPAQQFPNQTRLFARKLMFAPAAVYKDGWFYLYFPFLRYQDGPSQVGVARSRNPTVRSSWELVAPVMSQVPMFDPSVMIDPDGRLFIYGNSRLKSEDPLNHRILGARLNDNMKHIVGEQPHYIRDVWVTEAVFVFWRKHPTTGIVLYYFVARWKTAWGDDSLRYWMSTDPVPWRLQRSKGFRLSPNQYDAPAHASVIEFEGKHFMFYHSGQVNSGNPWKRSTCVDELKFLDNGRIVPISFTCAYSSARGARG